MKRLLFIFLILIGTVSQSFASFYIDIMGAMVNADDLENQTGFGIGLGYGLNDEIDLYFRSMRTEATENANLFNEIKYEHVTAAAGVVFAPVLPVLERFRISWRNTFLVGYSMSDVYSEEFDNDTSDQGLSASLWTGIQFDATQMISPFFEMGYHKSFYENKMEDLSVQGLQFALGVRFYLTNTKKYSQGY